MSVFHVNSRLSVLLEEVAAVNLSYATVLITLRSGRVEEAEFLYGNGRGNEVDARERHKQLLAAWKASEAPPLLDQSSLEKLRSALRDVGASE